MNVTLVIAIGIAVLALGYTGGFAASAVAVPAAPEGQAGRSRMPAIAAKSRLGLLTAALDAVVLLVLVHLLAPWTLSPTALWLAVLWFVPVILLAVGIGATVLRWDRLPTLRPGRSERRAWVAALVHVVVVVGVLLLALWPR